MVQQQQFGQPTLAALQRQLQMIDIQLDILPQQQQISLLQLQDRREQIQAKIDELVAAQDS